jgi:hypothetical protein
LDVVGRNAAQREIAHVEAAPIVAGADRGGMIVDVGDDPDAIANIKGARLAGNVRRWEMVVQERPKLVDLILGDDRTDVIVEELVDHDPVEARQLAKSSSGKLEQAFEVRRVVEQITGFIKRCRHQAARQSGSGKRLKLYNQQIIDKAHRRVERFGHAPNRKKHGDQRGARGQLRNVVRNVLAQNAAERIAEPIGGQTLFKVTGGTDNFE